VRFALFFALAACHHAAPAKIAASAIGPPGVVIDHRDAASGEYIGSPSIAILADGTFVASHDFFGPKTTRDKTVVFASTDRGAHWEHRADIDGQWWSTLFVHRGALYLMGVSKEFGHVVIRRSADARTWTTPDSASTGRLTRGDGFHCAPVPVVEHAGRLFRAFENHHGRGPFHALVASAPVDAELLDAASWTFTSEVPGDEAWLDRHFSNWLEGNVVAAPDGTLVDILRVNTNIAVERAAVLHVSADAAHVSFDPAAGFVDFPGASKKFTIRFDAKSRSYWTLANAIHDPIGKTRTEHVRNTLVLSSSADLTTWSERRVVLHHDDREKHAFQYVDWLFDGDDIVLVSRTAFDDAAGGAHNFHDANYLTFHRLERFRLD